MGAATAATVLASTATAAAQSGGGAYSSLPAVVSGVSCSSRCAGDGAVRAGGVVRVTGRRMEQVLEVIFLGGRGNADDVRVRARRVRAGSVDVKVPARAPSGRVRLRNRDGAQSEPTTAAVRVMDAAAVADPPSPGSADVDMSDRIDARVERRRVFFGGFRKAALRYVVTGDAPLALAVDVVRAGDGASVARWTPGLVAPGVAQRIVWDGTSAGAVVPQGRYRFRVTPLAASAAQSGASQVVEGSFRFLDHKFPVRGAHSYGSDIARFGAARAGHTHQGHDVFATCGTPLVAARGGTVVRNAWQDNAGNYVVIDGDGTDVDYAYMHMREPALVARGDRVRTGQRIGEVGDTGDAVGCHLHFEMWSGPGWYEGGRPFDPLAQLRGWDAQS
jgi:murein DD-endopeptidase MepM/ murein hydrolase activator NlpD